jgi:phage shock protein A
MALGAMKMFDEQSALGEQDETFTLLQEFGTVLQVNIHDELNKSEDRAQALNVYLQALTDTTERAKKQLEIITVEQKNTEKEASDQRRKVNELKSAIGKAQKSGDFAASGTAQKDLVKEQTTQAELDSKVEQLKQLVQTYKQLITVAGKRYDAIQQNREIIISGLKVIDVPGIEDLNILKGTKNRRGGGGLDLGFGNL